MPNIIKHKRNSVAGTIPATGVLDQAELAINIADGKLYTKNNANSVINLGVTSISGTSITPASGTFQTIQFNTNVQPDLLRGQIGWNDTEGTVNVALTDNTDIHIGQHNFYRVRNETGSVLYKGQAVYATGVHSNGIITPSLYVANGSVREVRFIGLILEDINSNNNGYAIQFGHIEEIDTRGNVASNIAVGNETWADGDILYVHPTVSGKLTNVEPKHSISTAIILDAASNGKIFVRPTSYGHLNDNHDVNVSGATNGQFLQYNSSTDYWVPTSSGNFTSLSVNGTGVISSSGGTTNYISKFTGSSTIGNSIIYDDGTNVGIGTATPSTLLEISKDGGAVDLSLVRIANTNATGGTALKISRTGPQRAAQFIYQSGTTDQFYQGILRDGGVTTNGWSVSAGADLNVTAPAIHVTSGNYVGIGTKSPQVLLHVNGQAYLQSLNLTGGTADRILATDTNKNVVGLNTSTYPTLTELSYVRGTTSAIQTQIDSKQATLTNPITGTGTNGKLSKWSSTNTLTNSIISDDGTTSTIGTIGGTRISIAGIGGANAVSEYYSTEANPRWQIGRDLIAGGLAGIGFATSSTIAANGAAVGLAANKELGLYSSNGSSLVERVRITTAGNVGIGTTSPESSLTINTTIGSSSNINSTAGYAFGIHHSGMRITSPEDTSTNPNYPLINLLVSRPGGHQGGTASIDFDSRDRGNAINRGIMARILGGNAPNTAANTSGGGYLSLEVAPTGSTIPISRMAITRDGNVGIGTATPSYALNVNPASDSNNGIQILNNSAGTSARSLLSLFNGNLGAEISLGGTGFTNNGFYRANRLLISGPFITDYVSAQHVFNIGGGATGQSTTGSTQVGIWDINALSVVNGVAGGVFSSSFLTLKSTTANGTTDYIRLAVGNNGATEAMRVINNGNVGIGTTTPTYKLQVNGSFAASTKSFRINHPSKKDHSLEYGSLESPYHGVRLTGRGKVIKGVGTVSLPDYLKDLIHDDDTLNIQITNIKHGKTIYLEEIDLQNDQFIVKVDRAKSLGELQFCWTLTGVRKDVDHLVVEKEN